MNKKIWAYQLLILVGALIIVGYLGSKEAVPDSDIVAEPIKLEIDDQDVHLPSSPIDTSDWKTYRNEEYGFEFKYPKDLTFNEFKKGEPKHDPTLMNLLIQFNDSNKVLKFFIGVNNLDKNNRSNLIGQEISTMHDIIAKSIENSTRIIFNINSKNQSISLIGIKPIKKYLINTILSTFQFVEYTEALQ